MLKASLVLMVICASPASAGKTGPDVSTITKDQRYYCKLIGPVYGTSDPGKRSASQAMVDAMVKTRQMGGNGLYIVKTSKTATTALLDGHAYLCPTEPS